MQTKNGGGGLSKAAVLPCSGGQFFPPPEELLTREKGISGPVIGPGPTSQCIEGWGGSVPIKGNLKDQGRDDEHMRNKEK